MTFPDNADGACAAPPTDIEWLTKLDDGDLVVVAQGTGEPTALLAGLAQHTDGLPDIEVFVGLSHTDVLASPAAERLPLVSFGAMGPLARRTGPLQVLPSTFSDLPRQLLQRTRGRLVLLMQVGPADDTGCHSLGCAVDYTYDLVDRADIIVAEVNNQVPHTSAPRLETARLTYRVPTSRPLPHPAVDPPGPVQRALAAHVAALVPDGATLQLGVGSFATAVGEALTLRRGLRVRSTLAGDWLLTLARAGALSPAEDAIAICELSGADELHSPERPFRARFLPVSALTDPGHLGSEQALFAVNAAIEVDLTGQVNAEALIGRYVGGVAGQPDFLRAAQRTRGGLSVIALPATAGRHGVSRIVHRLGEGTVTTARSQVDVVVTEHGVADLRGRSLAERAQALVAVAAPEHRADLSAWTKTPA